MSVGDRLIPPAEALEILQKAITFRLPCEDVPLEKSGGRILGRSLVASHDLPAFPASTMDGFAVIADDVSPWREIIVDQFAGHMVDDEVTEGTAARIMTGAPVPSGADTVVPVERTELREDHVVILDDELTEGANIRPVGADLKEGELLVPAGAVIGPAEIGLLASFGWADVPVVARPKISILSTGDELVEPDQEPGPGQIRDSNRFSLLVAAQMADAEIVFTGHGPDERDELRDLLQRLIAESDIVITSGGVSVGDKDLVKELLDELATVHFRRLFMKPGKPLNFATTESTLIFGLPGNPVSAMVGFEVFIKSAIRLLSGRPNVLPRTVPVTLTHSVDSTDRLEYQRAVVWANDEGRLMARNTGSQQSARLMSYVGANSFILIAPRDTAYEAGEQVEALLLKPVTQSSELEP